MSRESLRKVKEVNGWKVNHPHSGANICYALFTLIALAIPVAYCFLPTVIRWDISVVPNLKDSFNGIDMVKFFIAFIKMSLGETYPIENALVIELYDPNFSGTILFQAVPYLYLIAAGSFLLIGVFSVVLLIICLVNLIKGYLKHPKVVKVFITLSFVFSLIYGLAFLVLFVGFVTSPASTSGQYQLFPWYNFAISGGYLLFLIIISAIYSANFRDSIPESELEMHDDEPTVEHISQVHEITKVNYEQSSSLQPNLTSIGGHAFAENQNLMVANIPIEVTKLGPSAFANCLQLKVVSIPDTLTEIGFNCFFNCAALERINYAGTKEDWKKIRRGSNWLAKAGTTEVTCIDGVIIVNPFH